MSLNLLKQHLALFDNGERFPVLSNADADPVFLPNMYLVTERRPKSVASNTLKRDGRAIMHLYAWACVESIDIEARFEAGRFLTLNEVESLTRACHLRYETLTAALEKDGTHSTRSRVIPMPAASEVDSSTAYTHMSVIAQYLDWLETKAMNRLPESRVGECKSFTEARKAMKRQIESHRPIKRGRNAIGLREGLSEHDLDLLLTVVSPVGWRTGELSPSAKDWQWDERNPWKRCPVRVRNFLMVQTLLNLGIRIGELLGVKMGDIDFNKNTVMIRRAPDDPTDPRRYEPNAKRYDRVLPINNVLLQLLDIYLCEVRRPWVPYKGDHLFVFVSEDGRPLSISSSSKLWMTLRAGVPQLPREVSNHILRHTWNDLFSEAKDRDRIGPSTLIEQNNEQKERSHQMGWSPTSSTSKFYTRRHIRKKAAEASLKLQNEIMRKGYKQ